MKKKSFKEKVHQVGVKGAEQGLTQPKKLASFFYPDPTFFKDRKTH
jgi:hypothetical protein